MPLLAALLGGSTIFDIESTFRGVNNGYTEANPLMAPFVKAGRVPTYLAAGGLDALQLAASNELRKRGKGYWWVPMAATAALHVGAGLLNRHKP